MVDQLPRLRWYQPSLAQELLYYAFQFPYFVTQVLPVGVMLATLIALGGLARNSELTSLPAVASSRSLVVRMVLRISGCC
ncbi:MAG: LptF/LptG family permease [Rhizomicrobium sp.]